MNNSLFERWIKGILVLNLFDGTVTAFWLHHGLATETNPIMAAAWEIHPLVFIITKLALVSLGLFALHYAYIRDYKIIPQYAITFFGLLYAMICIGHSWWIFRFAVGHLLGMEVTS